MKNKKGEIATLLTLGLVVVGTLITLGTSLFVSNKKTNLASNSRAGTTYSCCKVYETSSACGGNKRIQNQGNAFTSTCTANNLVECSTVGGPPTAGASICPTSGPAAGAENGACRSAAPKCDGTLTCTGGICVKPAASPAAGTQGGACRSADPKCDGALVCNVNKICAANTSGGATANLIAGTNPGVGEGQSCCFQKKGKVYVYATYQSMVNNQMLMSDGVTPDCGRQTPAVKSSYQADDPPGAFVCAGGTSNMTSIDTYNTTNPSGGNPPGDNGELVAPEGYTGTNCNKHFGKQSFSSTVLIAISTTEPPKYCKSGDCAAGTIVDTLGELEAYCKKASEDEVKITCVPDQSCREEYSGNGNKFAYSIDLEGVKTYYKGRTCFNTPKATGETDVKAYCTLDPDAEENATCNKNVLCSSIGSTNKQAKISSKTFNATTVYYDSPDSCDSQSMSKDDAVAACNSKPQDIPIGIENPIGDTITKDGATYYYCFAKTDNSVFENDPVPLINKCKDFYGDDYEIGRKWDNYYCCKKQ